VPFGGKKQSGIGTRDQLSQEIAAGPNRGVSYQVGNWVVMPSMSISPPRLSTGTTARISNGPCRLTGADGIETSSRVNFLYLYFVLLFVGYCRRKNEGSCFQVPASNLTKTSTCKFLIRVGCLEGVTRPPMINVSVKS
jgi:hypothetical protein